MKKLVLALILTSVLSIGCKKDHGYVDTGAIIIDEELVEEKFRQGNTYPQNRTVPLRWDFLFIKKKIIKICLHFLDEVIILIYVSRTKSKRGETK